MANPFENTMHPLSIEDIEEVEKSLETILPSALREHYLRHNGGCPKKYLYRKDGRVFVVQGFLPMKYGPPGTRFEDKYRNLKEVIPDCLIPFAIDPGGDYYCVSTRESDCGSMWLYIGEYFDEPDRATLLLCASLQEFLEGMTDE